MAPLASTTDVLEHKSMVYTLTLSRNRTSHRSSNISLLQNNLLTFSLVLAIVSPSNVPTINRSSRFTTPDFLSPPIIWAPQMMWTLSFVQNTTHSRSGTMPLFEVEGGVPAHAVFLLPLTSFQTTRRAEEDGMALSIMTTGENSNPRSDCSKIKENGAGNALQAVAFKSSQ